MSVFSASLWRARPQTAEDENNDEPPNKRPTRNNGNKVVITPYNITQITNLSQSLTETPIRPTELQQRILEEDKAIAKEQDSP